MNQSIYDLVTAANVVEYWLQLNVNAQPYFGETLFPSKRVVGIKLDWIKGAKNQPVGLRLAAYDTKAIRRDRQGIEEYQTKMPFFKESKYIDEDMRQKLNTLIGNSNNKELVNRILREIFNDEIELIEAAAIKLERMRMEVLTNGTITLAENGQAYEYDFGIPADQKMTASVSWSDPSADIIKEINDIKDAMKAKGVTITRAICNNEVIKYLEKNTNIKNQIYVLAGGSISSINGARALSYLEDETGITFFVYDNVYVDEDGQAHKYIADDTVVFIPDGTLGYTNMGTTPEESDLMASGIASVRVLNNGVAVTEYKTVDPVNVEVKVSMVGMPSFERANEVVILDTDATTSA